MTTSRKVKHEDSCDTVIEVKNELIAFKKELRATFWKKLTVAITILIAVLSSCVGGCAYVLDRSSDKFAQQDAVDAKLSERLHEEEKKSVEMMMLMKQWLALSSELRGDMRAIKDAQHRMELEMRGRTSTNTP